MTRIRRIPLHHHHKPATFSAGAVRHGIFRTPIKSSMSQFLVTFTCGRTFKTAPRAGAGIYNSMSRRVELDTPSNASKTAWLIESSRALLGISAVPPAIMRRPTEVSAMVVAGAIAEAWRNTHAWTQHQNIRKVIFQ